VPTDGHTTRTLPDDPIPGGVVPAAGHAGAPPVRYSRPGVPVTGGGAR
jgi:hypothetical protein